MATNSTRLERLEAWHKPIDWWILFFVATDGGYKLGDELLTAAAAESIAAKNNGVNYFIEKGR